MQETKLITQSTVLGMGWTKKMIDTLLPEPILKDNPRYRCAAPMRLFEEEVVLAVMKTDEFIAAFEKTEKRRESSWKANQTKRDKLEKLVDECIKDIKVDILPDDELVSKTLEEREDWYRYNAEIRGEYDYRFYADYNRSFGCFDAASCGRKNPAPTSESVEMLADIRHGTPAA